MQQFGRVFERIAMSEKSQYPNITYGGIPFIQRSSTGNIIEMGLGEPFQYANSGLLLP